jgi:anti-anti-sigma factor
MDRSKIRNKNTSDERKMETGQSEDGFAILELVGSLTLSPSLTALRDTARQLLDSAKLTGIILVVGGVTLTDSAGLGELTVAYTFASRRRCPIVLVKVPPSLRKMLHMTRLEGLLPSAGDVASAKKKLS